MAGISVTVDFDNMPEPYIDDDAISAWIDARLNDTRNRFIQSVSRTVGTRSGATYRRGRRRIHVASAPGQYPATDSGRLVSSIYFSVSGREGTIYSSVEYARFLAEGTKDMAARLMLDDALREVLESRPASDRLASGASVR